MYSSWNDQMNQQMRHQMNKMNDPSFFRNDPFNHWGPSPFFQHQHWYHPWYSSHMPIMDIDDLFNPHSQALVDARQQQLNSLDETKAPDQQIQGQQGKIQGQQGQLQEQIQGQQGQLLPKDQQTSLSLPRAIRQGILVDVVERDNFFELTADLPGLNKNDLRLSVDNNVITICANRKYEREIIPSGEKVGEKEKEKGAGVSGGKPTQWRRFERMYGQAERSLRLPANVDASKINAQYRDGVLSLTLPKTQHPPRQPLQNIHIH